MYIAMYAEHGSLGSQMLCARVLMWLPWLSQFLLPVSADSSGNTVVFLQ
jgi:hypothetical protein